VAKCVIEIAVVTSLVCEMISDSLHVLWLAITFWQYARYESWPGSLTTRWSGPGMRGDLMSIDPVPGRSARSRYAAKSNARTYLPLMCQYRAMDASARFTCCKETHGERHTQAPS